MGGDSKSQKEMLSLILRNDVPGVRVMLDQGFDPRGCIDSSRTALFKAVEVDAAVICELLVARGADVNHQHSLSDGTIYLSPLHVAAKRGKIDICRILLDAGGNPNAVAICGMTPLHMITESGASYREWVDICGLLLERGADPNAVADRYFDVHSALNRSKKARSGSSIFDKLYVTPLHAAIRTSKLVEANPVEEPHDAAYGSGAAVVELLLQHGADLSFAPSNLPADYLTPLQLAVKVGESTDARLLLKSPAADLAQRTAAGRTLLQLASGRPEIKEMIFAIKTTTAIKGAIMNGDPKDLDSMPIGRQNGLSPL